MPIDFLFSILLMALVFTEHFLSLKSSLFAKSLPSILIFSGSQYSRFKYLTKHRLNHSLSLVFWLFVKSFLRKSKSFGNLIWFLPAKGLYFEVLIVWSMTQSIIQPDPFSIVFCIFVYNCSIVWLKRIINVTCIDNYFCFWTWIKTIILCFILTFCFQMQKLMLSRI